MLNYTTATAQLIVSNPVVALYHNPCRNKATFII